jgi:hypothetical protein
MAVAIAKVYTAGELEEKVRELWREREQDDKGWTA